MDYEYVKAYMVAEQLAQRLERSCEKLQIAGSLRRRVKVVHDIEIVAMPKIEELPDVGLVPNPHPSIFGDAPVLGVRRTHHAS